MLINITCKSSKSIQISTTPDFMILVTSYLVGEKQLYYLVLIN